MDDVDEQIDAWCHEKLDRLRWDWGTAYVFTRVGSQVWTARRRDNGQELRAAGPGELRLLVHADYTSAPVPR